MSFIVMETDKKEFIDLLQIFDALDINWVGVFFINIIDYKKVTSHKIQNKKLVQWI